MKARDTGPAVNLIEFLEKTMPSDVFDTDFIHTMLQEALAAALHSQSHGGEQVVHICVGADGALSAVWVERAPIEWNALISTRLREEIAIRRAMEEGE